MKTMEDTQKAFDYQKAIEELERIAEKVEDPSTGLEEMDSSLKRSAELVEQCRAYLREARVKLDDIA